MRTDIYVTWLPPQFDFIDRGGSKGQRGMMRVGRGLVLPLVRSLDADDAQLGPGVYKMAMEKMATKKQADGQPRRALFFVSRWDATKMDWGPNTYAKRGLALHDFGTHGKHEIRGTPRGLDGCGVPGIMFRGDGVALPVTAMGKLFEALGGWKAHEEFTLQILP